MSESHSYATTGQWTFDGNREIRVVKARDGALAIGLRRKDSYDDLVFIPPDVAAEIAAALGPEENDETAVCPECSQTVDVIDGRLTEHRWTDTNDGNEGRCVGSGISSKVDAATHDERIAVLEDQVGILSRKVKELDKRAGPILGEPTATDPGVTYPPAYRGEAIWRPLVEGDEIHSGIQLRHNLDDARIFEVLKAGGSRVTFTDRSVVLLASIQPEMGWEILR